PPTDLHLGLGHDRVANSLGLSDRFVDRISHPPRRHRNPEAGKVLLALVLEQVHTPIISSAACNKFLGSRRLRASPQGYSPWTSVPALPPAPPVQPSPLARTVSRAGDGGQGDGRDSGTGDAAKRTQRAGCGGKARDRGAGRVA